MKTSLWLIVGLIGAVLCGWLNIALLFLFVFIWGMYAMLNLRF